MKLRELMEMDIYPDKMIGLGPGSNVWSTEGIPVMSLGSNLICVKEPRSSSYK